MSSPTVLFIGVATSGSRILELFPRWMDAIGMKARIEGLDLPLDTPPGRYREVVEEIRSDPSLVGAVITTHKLRLYEAAHDLFDTADELVSLMHEVNSISKQNGTLMAHARDPLATSACLRAMLGPDYWAKHEADVLCLGAGGAATAIALSILRDVDPVNGRIRPAAAAPRRLLVVDLDQRRLHDLRRMIEGLHGGITAEYHHHLTGQENDALLASLPGGSLVINASGMGKDRPGSPVTDAARFPQDGIVWDLNYRGTLEFLAQAHRQEAQYRLRIHDGWRYFLHGWARTLSVILNLDLMPERFRLD